MEYKKPFVVAEIGCNHKGDFKTALELIDLAVECKADVAKFQKRSPVELLSPEQYNGPHPNPMHAYGNTYGEHKEFLEFTLAQHKQLKEYCETKNIIYSTSVWDVTSAKEIITLDPSFIKIPSASNTNFDLLEVIRDDYQGDVHISFGMTTRDEEQKIISFFKEKKQCKNRVVIYACTSGYPVPFESLYLLEIQRLKSLYEKKVKSVGFSGHHLGIAADIAAYTLGAEWIERHFTKDRTWKGTDHAASLEPPGLRKLVRDLNAVYKSLEFKPTEIVEIEEAQREKLKFRK